MPRSSKNRIASQHFTWNLFKRDDVWYADGRHNKLNAGKHSLGSRDRHEALEQLHALDRRRAFDLGLIRSLPRDDGGADLSIADGWDRYLEYSASPDVLGGTGEGTQKRYRAVRDKHQPFCQANGITSWGDIDKAAVTRYGAHLHHEGYGDATIYLECTLIKQVVKWLIEEKVLPESHRISLSLRRSEDSDTYCYTREQVRAMVERCAADPSLRWIHDVIVALATTGMRIGELARLRRSDVDLKAGVITVADNRHSAKAKKAGAVRTTKGRRTRWIDIGNELRALLERLPRRPDGKVFGGLNGGPLRPDKVLKVLRRDVIGPLAEKFPTPAGEVGFADGCVHSFRHYFVTEAFLGGATEGEVMDWVGHRNSRIVRRYRHLRRKTAQRRMGELDFLGGDRPETSDGTAPNPKSHEGNGNPNSDQDRNGEAGNSDGPGTR